MKNFWEILIYNIAFVGAWHVVAFVLCVYGSPSWFDFRRKRYQMFKWEKNGKWYVKYLKIKLWKDLVPTHVGKQGFSKDHLDTEDLSIHSEETVKENNSDNSVQHAPFIQFII